MSQGEEPAHHRAAELSERGRTTLRHSLGSPILFAVVYTSLASAVFFSLGVVADHALGLTPVVFLIAAVMFGVTAMTYMEGASLHPEPGGSTVFARYAFNEMVSFVAGWAMLLDYVILIAVTAFAATQYLSVFWAPLGHSGEALLLSIGIIALVVFANVRGFNWRREFRIGLVVVGALVLELVAIAIGLAQSFDAHKLVSQVHLGSAPTWSGLIFALTVTTIAFTSVESASGLAGEVKAGRGALRRLIASGTVTVVLAYVGIAVVAVTALPLPSGSASGHDFTDAPVIDVLRAFHPHWLSQALVYSIGLIAAGTLIAAADSAMLGLSRLAYSLSTNRQIPTGLGRLHPQRSTPYVLILLSGLIACALVIPESLDFLVGIYAFGAMLAFTIAHVSVVKMRYSEPGSDRPYRTPFSVKLRGGELPLLAVFGAIVCSAGWIATMVVHEPARYVGLGWMLGGIVLYVVYRRADEASLVAARDGAGGGPARRARARARVRVDPGAALRDAPGRGHSADGRSAGGGQADRRRRDRQLHDRGGLDLRDADVPAARRAPARRPDQARADRLGARQGGGGGVHGRAGGHGHDQGQARRPGDPRGGAPARRGGDRARRRGAFAHSRRLASWRTWGTA